MSEKLRTNPRQSNLTYISVGKVMDEMRARDAASRRAPDNVSELSRRTDAVEEAVVDENLSLRRGASANKIFEGQGRLAVIGAVNSAEKTD